MEAVQTPSPLKVIPAKPSLVPFRLIPQDILRKTAGYARVSTESDEQATSYEAQVDYYTKYIQNHDGWQFVGLYADDGISGTSLKNRDAFNQMVADALAGKIDLIVTKSVSRFSRNTVDVLNTVRLLKEKSVEVFFEKENLWTFDPKTELILTIMASLAQEESRNISENVTWGHRKRFADGKYSMPYKRFLGYEKGPDGKPQIVEAEAAIIRDIYRWFIEGKSKHWIAQRLMELGIRSPGGKEKWRPNTVESILSNEKYKGDALLQKTFTTDFLTKKVKANEGEVPQYYATDTHPAIISKPAFDLVQEEIRRRKEAGKQTCGTYPLSGRIYCGLCGTMYGSKNWHSDDQYRHRVWECNSHPRKAGGCKAKAIREETIERAFVVAINQLIDCRKEILGDYRKVIRTLTDTTAIDKEIASLEAERDAYELLIRQEIERAKVSQSEAGPQQREGEHMERFVAARDKVESLEAQRAERQAKAKRLSIFIRELERQDGLVREFDEQMWYTLVDHVDVTPERKLAFVFRDGQVVEVAI